MDDLQLNRIQKQDDTPLLQISQLTFTGWKEAGPFARGQTKSNFVSRQIVATFAAVLDNGAKHC